MKYRYTTPLIKIILPENINNKTNRFELFTQVQKTQYIKQNVYDSSGSITMRLK